MIRIFFLLIIFGIIDFSAFGQKVHANILVIDSVSRLPLPFSSIFNKNSKEYRDCDEYGFTKIGIEANDSLTISRVGYKDKLVKIIKESNDVKIELNQKVDTLENIEIVPFTEKLTIDSILWKKIPDNDFFIINVLMFVSLIAVGNNLKSKKKVKLLWK